MTEYLTIVYEKINDFLAWLFIFSICNILPMVMHMHIKQIHLKIGLLCVYYAAVSAVSSL